MTETQTMEHELEPLVNEAAEDVTQIIAAEHPEIELARIEKVAELAPRYEAALRKILLIATFPNDWEVFGDGDRAKVCLSSAGAERVAKHFPIQITDVKSRKEEFTDGIGAGYRYVYECRATLGSRIVYAQGNYSTRDKFLGFANSEWRDIEDISEGNVRNAAYHIMTGNAIKALLGLRAWPVDEYRTTMERTGQASEKTTQHEYKKRGGFAHSDAEKAVNNAEFNEHKRECKALAEQLANDAISVFFDGEQAVVVDDPDATWEKNIREAAKFKGKDGKVVDCPKDLSKLSAARCKVIRNVLKRLVDGD